MFTLGIMSYEINVLTIPILYSFIGLQMRDFPVQNQPDIHGILDIVLQVLCCV